MTFLEWVADNKGFCAFVLVLFVFIGLPMIGSIIGSIVESFHDGRDEV